MKNRNDEVIDRMIGTLSEGNPRFARAIAVEEAADAFCDAVRGEIRAHLAKRKMTQGDLAKRMGVSASSVSHFLNGSGDVSVSTIWRYASALGVRPMFGFLDRTEAADDFGYAPLVHTSAVVPRMIGAREAAFGDAFAFREGGGVDALAAYQRITSAQRVIAENVEIFAHFVGIEPSAGRHSTHSEDARSDPHVKRR